MTQTRTLTLVNNSPATQTLACFQAPPSEAPPPFIWSVAWFAAPVAPGKTASFSWAGGHQFVWDGIGPARPGLVFKAAQAWDASPTGKNLVSFVEKKEREYTFENLTTGGAPGHLTITQGPVPVEGATIGVNMPATSDTPGAVGTATMVSATQPFDTKAYAAEGPIWVTWGDYTPGGIIYQRDLPNSAAEVKFRGGVDEMYAMLDADHSWKIYSRP